MVCFGFIAFVWFLYPPPGEVPRNHSPIANGYNPFVFTEGKYVEWESTSHDTYDGLQKKVLFQSNEVAGLIQFALGKFKPLSRSGWHKHGTASEVFHVLEGRLTVEIKLKQAAAKSMQKETAEVRRSGKSVTEKVKVKGEERFVISLEPGDSIAINPDVNHELSNTDERQHVTVMYATLPTPSWGSEEEDCTCLVWMIDSFSNCMRWNIGLGWF
jgi:quercetin dioxygenase-like cupin family protein